MKMKRIMKSTRGEGYIDLAVAVLVLVFVLVIAISLWSAITLKQDMRYLCEELIATATSTGKVGEEVEQRFAELCEETGITPTVTWNTTYYNATKKQVQLGEIITCTLTHEITLQGFGTFTLPFSVTVTQSGLRMCIGSERDMKMLRNKKGFSYILTCVLVLAVVMMIAVSVQYSLVFSLVRSEKETSRLALTAL